MPVVFLLLLVALILFVLAALPISSPINLGWAGMAFFAGAVLAGAHLF